MLDSVVMAEWVRPEYSRTAVDKAGRLYALGRGTSEERQLALAVINNWRAAHSYPLNTFQVGLRNIAARYDPQPLVAQRTKRLPSITLKIQLKNDMSLSRMQDIGGCRAILQTLAAVQGSTEYYVKRTRHKHKLLKKYDYINEPKPDGYRGIHLVYGHKSTAHPVWDGLRIEVQIRTQLQHTWATAVETVGLFEGQALKSGLGDHKSLRFFALMGSALAAIEGTSIVPNTPSDQKELHAELKALAASTMIVDRLSAITVLFKENVLETSGANYLMLDLDIKEQMVTVHQYSRRAKAELEYAAMETATADSPERDVVLVAVNDLKGLRRAYPNYFADTSNFVSMVKDVLGD